MDELEVTVMNWEKYQDRKDIKHPSWFRLENRFYNSQSLFGLSAEEKYAWICVLSIASQRNSASISISIGWFEHQTGANKKSLLSSLDKLTCNGCVTYTGKSSRARANPPRDVTDVQTDVTYVTGRDGTGKSKTVAPAPAPAENWVGTYVRAWQGRYGTKERPNLGGANAGVLKRMKEAFPPEKLSLMLQVYCQLNDKWLVTKCHDLVTFEANINLILLALDKGREKPNERTWEDIIDEQEGKDGQAKLRIADEKA